MVVFLPHHAIGQQVCLLSDDAEFVTCANFSYRSYNAHETSAVEPFAFILACGDADFKASLPRQLNHNMSCADQVRVQMYSGVIVVDGNRMRFSVDDWKLMLVIKILRQSLRQIMAQSFRDPGYLLSPQQQIWLDIWTKIFGYHAGKAASGKP